MCKEDKKDVPKVQEYDQINHEADNNAYHFAVDNGTVKNCEETTSGCKEMKLRELLWVNHGCPTHALYGDDGEMQCSICGIDFKRDSESTIREIIITRNLKKMAEFLQATQEK